MDGVKTFKDKDGISYDIKNWSAAKVTDRNSMLFSLAKKIWLE